MLSEKTAKEAKPTDKPQKLPHEKGLYLYISPKGGKSWRFDYRFADKRCTLTLGQYPEVSFVAALNKHLEARTKLAEGINPAQQKKIAKHELLLRPHEVSSGGIFDAGILKVAHHPLG